MNVFSYAYRIKNPLEWKKLPGQMAIPALLTLFICIMPMYLLYARNTTEMEFMLIVSPIAVSVACGSGLLCVFTLILRKPGVAGLWSAAVMALCLNFNVLTSISGTILPFIDASAGGILLILIVLTGVFFLIRLLAKKKIENQIALILMGTMGVLLLYNTITIIPAIVRNTGEMAASRSSSAVQAVIMDGDAAPAPAVSWIGEPETGELVNPDIYIFVLDEYADFVALGKYYNASAEAFKQFLINAGFNISYSSYTNSGSTPRCLADLVNLAYVTTDKMTSDQARKLNNKDAVLHIAMQTLGYTLYQISTHQSAFNMIGSLRDPEVLAKAQYTTADGKTVDEIAAGYSILSIFSKKFNNYGGDTTGLEQAPLLTTGEVLSSEAYKNMDAEWKPYVKNVLGIFDFFQDRSNLNFNSKAVVYSYICSPHVPFLFNSDGSILTGQRLNWADKAYYLGQHQFICRRLQLVFTSILQHNPECIIVLQSDHGVRDHAGGKLNIETKDAHRIFNAVYFGGQELDIEGKSGLNTLRLILTRLGAAEYPQVADPMLPRTGTGDENDDID